MKTVLTINKPLSYPKELNHPCLMSLELDNPLSRINAPASILKTEAGKNVIQCDRIRPPFLRANRGTLFRIANENSYVTVLEGYDDIIRYDIVEVEDDETWTLSIEPGCEFVVIARPQDIITGKDESTGYCEHIECVFPPMGKIGKTSW